MSAQNQTPRTSVVEDTASKPEPIAPSALRERIVDLISRAASIPASELDDARELETLGLDSVRLISLSADIEEEINRPLTAMALYDHPTLGELVDYLHRLTTGDGAQDPASGKQRPNPVLNLDAEVYLHESIAAGPDSRRADSGEVLLTGATGFLGAFLLEGLLEEKNRLAHCLVRAEDQKTGLARIQRNLARYGIWRDDFARRIAVIPGDMAQPRLGLDEEGFRALAERIGAIYHNGALLRFDLAYRGLEAANVGGTREILRLATTGPIKPVHYVSTAFVFEADAYRDAEVDEQTPLTHWRGTELGYAQTKWVSEKLIQLAGRRGVPVTIFRPAGIAGDSRSGAWNTGDIICRVLKGCILQGQAFQSSARLDMAPVDYVSQALLWLARRSQHSGAIYHLNYPRQFTWQQMFALLRRRGYRLEEVDYPTWVGGLIRNARDDSHPLLTLIPYLAERTPAGNFARTEMEEHFPNVRCALTQDALQASGLDCPPIEDGLLDRWLTAMVAEGFLPAGDAP